MSQECRTLGAWLLGDVRADAWHTTTVGAAATDKFGGAGGAACWQPTDALGGLGVRWRSKV